MFEFVYYGCVKTLDYDVYLFFLLKIATYAFLLLPVLVPYSDLSYLILHSIPLHSPSSFLLAQLLLLSLLFTRSHTLPPSRSLFLCLSLSISLSLRLWSASYLRPSQGHERLLRTSHNLAKEGEKSVEAIDVSREEVTHILQAYYDVHGMSML